MINVHIIYSTSNTTCQHQCAQYTLLYTLMLCFTKLFNGSLIYSIALFTHRMQLKVIFILVHITRQTEYKITLKVGKFEKPARDTLFVIFHGMLLTS